MSVSVVQCGFEEAYDYCQVMLFKLNSKQYIVKNYSWPGRETEVMTRVENIVAFFPAVDGKLKLFFESERKNVSFMSQYFYESKCKGSVRTIDDLYNVIQKDKKFKERLIQFYLEKNYSSDQEMIHALMTEDFKLDSQLKEMLIYFSMFEAEYLALLFDSMQMVKKEIKKLYKQKTEQLVKLQEDFDFDVIIEKKSILDKWAKEINELEVSFSYCNQYVFVSGEIIENRSWMILGCNFWDSLGRRWNSELPIEKIGNALGDAMRIRIIQEIQKRGEMSAPQLAKLLNLPSSAVFYHLDVLKKAFVLCSRMSGRTAYYLVDRGTFEYAVQELKTLGGM